MSALKKRLTIEYDLIDGEISVLNDDEMSYIEVLGALEYAKMMMMNDWQNSE